MTLTALDFPLVFNLPVSATKRVKLKSRGKNKTKHNEAPSEMLLLLVVVVVVGQCGLRAPVCPHPGSGFICLRRQLHLHPALRSIWLQSKNLMDSLKNQLNKPSKAACSLNRHPQLPSRPSPSPPNQFVQNTWHVALPVTHGCVKTASQRPRCP